MSLNVSISIDKKNVNIKKKSKGNEQREEKIALQKILDFTEKKGNKLMKYISKQYKYHFIF